MAMDRVGALVLTFNRKVLLSRCLDAISAQTQPPSEVIVVDNGSTDGTDEYLRVRGAVGSARLAAYRLGANLGPAAGFDILIRLAYQRGFDWLWCMDDDVIPDPTALEELRSAFAENFSRPEEVGFLVSAAVDGRGEPSNVPGIDLRTAGSGCANWAELLDRGLVKLRWSTFSSILIPRTTLLRFGGLAPDFYFAGEDIDFTLRVTEAAPGYLVGKSKVAHLREVGGVLSALTEANPRRIHMTSYYYRNNLYFRRTYSTWLRAALFVGKCGWETLLALVSDRYRLRRAASIVQGVLTGFSFAPKRPSIDEALTVPMIQLAGDTRDRVLADQEFGSG
jgi:GT2 family glycosyltransferase